MSRFCVNRETAALALDVLLGDRKAESLSDYELGILEFDDAWAGSDAKPTPEEVRERAKDMIIQQIAELPR